MQALLHNFAMIAMIISGILIILLVISQKSSSEGLVDKVSNPFSSKSSNASPATKITRISVSIFIISCLVLTAVYNKKDTKTSLLEEGVKTEENQVPVD